MRKKHELADPSSCLNKARDDELIFVLLGRDRAAAATIRFWCDMRVAFGMNKRDDKQILDAEAIAREIGG